MDILLRGELTESISSFEQILESDNSSSQGLASASILCNIAVAEFELQLYRKCVSTCSRAIECDKNYLRAYIIQGHAHKKLNKEKQALVIWERGLKMINDFSDFFVVLELKSLLGQSTCVHSVEQLFYPKRHYGNNIISGTTKKSDSIISLQSNTISSVPAQIPNLISTSDLLEFKRIYDKNVLNCKEPLNPTLIEAVRLNLAHSTGEKVVDDIISAGYLYVNTGYYDTAIEIFKKIIEVRSNIIAAYLGMGSAYALTNKFEEAISSFTSAIALDPTVADAWKRRGQTRGAKNLLVDSISDLSRALDLYNDSDTYMQRGIIYHKSRNFQRSLSDFRQAQRLGENSASLWNYIGMCEGQLGNIDLCLESYLKAIKLEPEFKEAHLNYAQMLKEIGNGEESKIAYQQLINQKDLCYDFPHVYSFRATLFIGQGNHHDAIDDIKQAINIYISKGKVEPQLLALLGSCYHTVGQFSLAYEVYNQVLEIDSDNNCWGNLLVLLSQWAILDSNLEYINLDKLISPYLKEACSKKLSKRAVKDSGYYDTLSTITISSTPPKDISGEMSHPFLLSQEKMKQINILLHSVSLLTHFVQLDSPGFLKNKRQHRSFGISVLQMAASLRQHISELKKGNKGLKISNLKSSSNNYGSSSSNASKDFISPTQKDNNNNSRDCDDKSHIFGYRDFFDIAVLWRQIAEPGDSVWWIDGLTSQAFEEGFGLQTPLVNGQLKTIRYYPYYPAAFRCTKDILLRDGYHNAAGTHEDLTDNIRKKIIDADSLQELYEAIGKDFFVITKCKSERVDESFDDSQKGQSKAGLDQSNGENRLEGTRLTLISHSPEGYEFTIRTAGTPERWMLLDKELQYCFDSLVDCLLEHNNNSYSSSSSSSSQDNCTQQSEEGNNNTSCSTSTSNSTTCSSSLLLERALKLFYYWVNFAPLTRGSAACGYAAFMAIVLAGGQLVSAALPRKVQLDWEAILEEDVKLFTINSTRFISLVDIPNELNNINPSDCIFSIRDMFSFLSM